MQTDGLGAALLHTEGFGLTARIEISGQRLYVPDAFSEPGDARAPGPLGQVTLGAEDFGDLSWEETFAGNPDAKKRLEHLGGHYRGCERSSA